MSLTITVVRDQGDNPGPGIVCNYFSSEQIFRQLGRVDIDKSATGLKLVTITVPGMRKHIRVGRVLKILDTGSEYRAKVKSIAFSSGRQAGPNGKPFAICSMSLRMLEVS